MRVLIAIVLSLLIGGPALAETAAKKKAAPAAQAKQAAPAAAKKAAAPAKPAPAAGAAKAAAPKAKKAAGKKAANAKPVPKPSPEAVAHYAAVPAAERRAIQSDLIWTGDYNGIPSDEFGDRSIAAVKSYQAHNGVPETGILTPEQRAALAAAAKAKQEASGWRIVDEEVSGVRLAVPVRRAPQASATKSGARWASSRGEVQIETFRIAEPGTTLEAVFEQQKKEPKSRRVEYNVLRDNFFVLSGLQGLKRFYVRAHAKDSEVRGFVIMYDQAMQGIMDPIAVAMSSRFEAFPSAAGPPPRRKVEYATGVVVDGQGHVITDRQATDGCNVISLAGLGSAELIGGTAQLALLRLYGARNLTPVGLAPDSQNASDLTLVGIADPQQQGGNAATTVTAARVAAAGASRPLEPAPALGFSGAAALDPQGRVVGVALLKLAAMAGPTYVVSQALFVPAEDIRSLLNGRNLAPANGPSGLDAAKAAVVRVICVRK